MNVQFLRDAFYKMRLDYGRPGKVFQIVSESTDSETGRRTVNQIVIPISQIVVAPMSVVRKFFFDLSYMKANNNFTYGGDFDIADMLVFIDAKYKVKIENELIIKHERFQIFKVVDVAEVFTMVYLKAQPAQPPYDVVEVGTQSNLRLTEGQTND